MIWLWVTSYVSKRLEDEGFDYYRHSHATFSKNAKEYHWSFKENNFIY